MISERHGNVIVNEGGASASDVLELMVLARQRVRERFGITLEPELQLLARYAGSGSYRVRNSPSGDESRLESSS